MECLFLLNDVLLPIADRVVLPATAAATGRGTLPDEPMIA